jgi:hypothetical protein
MNNSRVFINKVVKKCPTRFEALKRGHLVLRWDRGKRNGLEVWFRGMVHSSKLKKCSKEDHKFKSAT